MSIHSLAAAAHQLLTDVNKARGGTPTWKEQLIGVVRPEYVAEFRAGFAAPANFFKHADHDPTGTLPFNSDLTDTLLQDACLKYRDLTSNQTPLLVVYQIWFWLRRGDFLEPAKQQELAPFREAFAEDSRQTFFAAALPLAALRYRVTEGASGCPTCA